MNEIFKIAMQADAGQVVRAFSIADSAGKKFGASLEALNFLARGLGTAYDDAANKIKSFAIKTAAGGGAITASFAGAIKSAMGLETALNNVNSIQLAKKSDVQGWGRQLLQMSKDGVQSLDSLGKGLYNVASAGYKGDDMIKVLGQSSKAATAGLTDVDTASTVLIGTLKAYGAGVNEARKYSDYLFQSVNLGIYSFADLAQNMGEVIPMAAAAKVSLKEVGSAMAAITLAGVGPAEASTALMRLIQMTIDPSDELAKTLHRLGYESGAQALATDGLYKVMMKLKDAGGENITTLLQWYPEIRAARGALALLANGGKNYMDTQRGMNEATKGQGATQRALNEQMRSLSNQWTQAGNKIKAFFTEMGLAALPFVHALMNVVNVGIDLLSLFESLPGPVKSTIAAFFGLSGLLLLIGGTILALRAKSLLTGLAFKGIASGLANITGESATSANAVGGLIRQLEKAGSLKSLLIPRPVQAVRQVSQWVGSSGNILQRSGAKLQAYAMGQTGEAATAAAAENERGLGLAGRLEVQAASAYAAAKAKAASIIHRANMDERGSIGLPWMKVPEEPVSGLAFAPGGLAAGGNSEMRLRFQRMEQDVKSGFGRVRAAAAAEKKKVTDELSYRSAIGGGGLAFGTGGLASGKTPGLLTRMLGEAKELPKRVGDVRTSLQSLIADQERQGGILTRFRNEMDYQRKTGFGGGLGFGTGGAAAGGREPFNIYRTFAQAEDAAKSAQARISDANAKIGTSFRGLRASASESLDEASRSYRKASATGSEAFYGYANTARNASREVKSFADAQHPLLSATGMVGAGMTKVGDAIGSFRGKIANAAGGLRNLAGQVGGTIGILFGFAMAWKQSGDAAQANIDKMMESYKPERLGSNFKALDSVNAALDNTYKKVRENQGSIGGFLKAEGKGLADLAGGVVGIDAVKDSPFDILRSQEKLDAQKEKLKATLNEFKKNYTDIAIHAGMASKGFGLDGVRNMDLTSRKAKELDNVAKILGVDLGKNFDSPEAKRGRQAVINHLESARVAANAFGKDLSSVTDADIKRIQDLTQALDKQASAIRQNFMSQLALSKSYDPNRREEIERIDPNKKGGVTIRKLKLDLIPAQKQIADFYASVIDNSTTFTDDLNTAIMKGLDPQAVIAITQEGPDAAGKALHQVVQDQSGGLIQLMNQSYSAMGSLADRAIAYNRIVTLATQDQSGKLYSNYKRAMMVQNEIFAEQGKATWSTVAKALSAQGFSEDDVKSISDQFGLGLMKALKFELPPDWAAKFAKQKTIMQPKGFEKGAIADTFQREYQSLMANTGLTLEQGQVYMRLKILGDKRGLTQFFDSLTEDQRAQVLIVEAQFKDGPQFEAAHLISQLNEKVPTKGKQLIFETVLGLNGKALTTQSVRDLQAQYGITDKEMKVIIHMADRAGVPGAKEVLNDLDREVGKVRYVHIEFDTHSNTKKNLMTYLDTLPKKIKSEILPEINRGEWDKVKRDAKILKDSGLLSNREYKTILRLVGDQEASAKLTKYLTEAGKTPKEISTIMEVLNTPGAMSDVQKLQDVLNLTPEQVLTTLSIVGTPEAIDAAGRYIQSLNLTPKQIDTLLETTDMDPDVRRNVQQWLMDHDGDYATFEVRTKTTGRDAVEADMARLREIAKTGTDFFVTYHDQGSGVDQPKPSSYRRPPAPGTQTSEKPSSYRTPPAQTTARAQSTNTKTKDKPDKWVTIEAQVKNKKDIDNLEKQVRGIKNKNVSIVVHGSDKSVQAVATHIRSVKGKRVEVLAVGKDGQVTAVRRNIAGVHGKTVNVHAETGKSVDKIRNVINARDDLHPKGVDVQAHTGNSLEKVNNVRFAIASLTGKHVSIDVSTSVKNANGNIFASGGESHIAQIGNGAMTRIWNEPETGGEAYIPLAAGKRSRSAKILKQVADRFGFNLLPTGRSIAYANGGVSPAAAWHGASSTSIVVHGSQLVVQGTADRSLLNDVRAMMDERDRRIARAVRATGGR